MKETTYLDPNFYVVSDTMNYTIRGEVVLNKSNDSSPSVLVTAMLTKVIWKLHPENKKDIVTGLGFNMRLGLGI